MSAKPEEYGVCIDPDGSDSLLTMGENKYQTVTRATDLGVYEPIFNFIKKAVAAGLEKSGLTAFPEIIDENPTITRAIMRACQNLEDINVEGSSLVRVLREKLELFNRVMGGVLTDSNFIITKIGDSGNVVIHLYSGNVHHNQYDITLNALEIKFLNVFYLQGNSETDKAEEVKKREKIILLSTDKAQANYLRGYNGGDFSVEEDNGVFFMVFTKDSEIGEGTKPTRIKITPDVLGELQ